MSPDDMVKKKISMSIPRNAWVLFFSGASLVLIGAMVLVGWYTDNLLLIQLHPQFASMKCNTALSFLLIGLSFLCLFFKMTRLSACLGLLVGLTAAATLVQYISGINFGVDEFLCRDWTWLVRSSFPGRMAPNTAIGFLLAAVALFTWVQWPNTKVAQYVCQSAALILAALGLAACLSYVLKIEGAYGWASLTRLAIHTSLSFCIVGTGFYSLVFQKNRYFLSTNGVFLISLIIAMLVANLVADME